MTKEKNYVRCGMCGIFLEKSTHNIITNETEGMLNDSDVELTYCDECGDKLNWQEYERRMQEAEDERRWREQFPNYY